MNILFSGSVDGEILDFYSRILDIEQEKKIPIDWVFAVGNFGIWPDPQNIDRATRLMKKTAGDFPYLYLNQWEAPRQTVIIEGVHDDHDWLEKRLHTNNLQLLPNVSLLANGSHLIIDDLSITGLGRSYSNQVFTGQRRCNKNYTIKDVQNAAAKPVHLLLTYEAPYDVSIGKFKSIAVGVDEIIQQAKPKLHVHSTPYHGVKTKVINSTLSVALGKRQTILFNYNNSIFSLIK